MQIPPDPGSSLPNSPFNAGDAKLDTNPKVTFLDDPTNTQSDTSYKSGAKENQECVEPTFHKNPPHKDDFAKVWGGFASGVDGTGGFAYLAWQRQSQGQGTATLEFELNQSSALCPNTQFGIHPRTVGDLLLEFNFSGGAGAADSFDERIWNGTEWGPEQPLPANSYEASGFETFGEITIDVHALPGQPCFTFGFGRNRSSNSFQAELKDFIGGIPLGTCTPPPPKTYVCSPPGATNITETSATLNGSTDDPDASTATFDLTGPGGSSTTKSLVNGKASADVTGLTANTQYSYTVAFKDAGGTTLGTSSACPFTTLPHHNVHLTLDVTKNNDANQDGVYSPSEPATSPNEDVSFRVRVTNPSSNGVAIKIDSPVTDVFPVGGANPTTKNVCDPDLVGKVLQPGDFVECTFTVANYPITFTSGNVVDRVTVTAHENNNSSNTVTNSAESTVTPPTPTLSLTVNKANDANQDGTYSKSEQANTAPQNVKFRATFANSSAVAVKITSLSDVYPSPSGSVTLSPAQMSPACAALIGTQIPAGQSATCDFTVNNYPLVRGGSSITNTVSATVVDVTNPNNTVTKTDTSTVVPPPVVLSLDVTKANDANQDGQYNQTETALTDLQDVKFRATFHNTSADAAQIVSLSDVFPGTTLTAAQMSPACAALIGTQIPAGQSASCDFTVARYPVQAGHPPVQDTITIKVQEVNNPSNTLTKTATSTVNPPNVLSLTVTKANDANQDGTYSKSETANTAPQNVKFRATFANSSVVAVKITTLSDVYPSPTGMVTLSPTDMSPACAALIGTQIPAGQSATCDFTVNNYPLVQGGNSITNTVSATVVDVTNPNNTLTETDTSTVNAPPAHAMAAR